MAISVTLPESQHLTGSMSQRGQDLNGSVVGTTRFAYTGPTTRIGEVTLYADAWREDMVGESLYYQEVVIEGVTEKSQVDLTPSIEQLAIFHHKDLAFVTENVDGVVTVYALGDKPLNDYTIQVTITEVAV